MVGLPPPGGRWGRQTLPRVVGVRIDKTCWPGVGKKKTVLLPQKTNIKYAVSNFRSIENYRPTDLTLRPAPS
jgi:hypothetical protein